MQGTRDVASYFIHISLTGTRLHKLQGRLGNAVCLRARQEEEVGLVSGQAAWTTTTKDR